MIGRLTAAAVALVLACSTGGAAPGAREFRAGAAVGDITPHLDAMIIGGFNPTPAKHIHDPLQVRAVVLDDGERRLALVVCDNIGLPREVCDEAKRLTRERTGLAPDRVLISSTHTHSAAAAGTETSLGPNGGRAAPGEPANPTGLTEYQRFIAQRIATTVASAIHRLEPARIGWGRAQEPGQVFNRRWYVSDEALRRNPFGGVDRVRMNPPAGASSLEQPAGPTDPEIPFLSVQARNGRPLALYAVYSLHYVGGVPAGVVSADYFGIFGRRMGELLEGGWRGSDAVGAPPFVGLLANGTSGDVNNINFRDKRAAQPPFQQMRTVANAVAAAVYRAYQGVEHHDWVRLDSRLEELAIASRRPSPEMVARARELLARPAGGQGWHPLEKAYANRVLQRAEAPATVPVTLQALRVGDAVIMALPPETFAEMGLELKRQAPFPLPMVVALANGYLGYMPTPEQHRLGGYETWIGTNRLEIDAAPKITAALLRLARQLQEPAK